LPFVDDQLNISIDKTLHFVAIEPANCLAAITGNKLQASPDMKPIADPSSIINDIVPLD
jgi:hypothetical protein